VICTACGGENPPGKKFCGDCAAPLLAECPSCHSMEEPGRRFCGECGSPLAGSQAAPARAQGAAPHPVSERRVCAVLFCDLVGFTPMSQTRDPEEVRELLSRYFDVARTVIGRYGGVVEKFIGDAVMAVWGTPVATEGDAERAVRAALEVVAAVATLGAETGVPGLAARAGVVTGEVAVTLGATNEGMVAGDAVNTAARVQGAAAPGAVWVDASTRRLTSSAIGFDDAGEHMLKGKTEPEQLWQVTRVLSGVGGAQRVDGLEAPLTGRDAELRTVKELFHASAERLQPRLVVISGLAGVGKSRLGWEFEKYIDGLADLVAWHRGRCLSYGDGVAFWALAEIVRQRLGIAEEDSTEIASGKLVDGLDQLVPDADERAYVGMRLARLLGVPYAGEPTTAVPREELFAGWRLFFERLASVEPVVLLVEDAQYADRGLLDFLDHLIDWSRDLPIFVLVFARPELEQVRPGFGMGRNRTVLTLDPLDEASMDALVEALVPGMPSTARQAITRQAQGVPLFAVETVRSLIDRDVVQAIGGAYRLVGEVGELAVPDSLHALFAGRLDALDPEVRTLVADAAVLGSAFPVEALVAASGRDPESVRAALAELLRREVLAVSADPLSPERGTYRFAQGMLRQVAYDTLSRRDRKARHLLVAQHLKTTFPNDGDEVAEVIAQHYLDALSAVTDDPDTATIRSQAVASLTRAAERATRTGAPSRAAANYASAAGLLDGPDGEPGDRNAGDLWHAAAEAAMTSAEMETSIGYAVQARQYFERHGDQRGAARAQTVTGQALTRVGRHSEARSELRAALAVLRADSDADMVRALAELAIVEIFAGTEDADALSAEALHLGQSLGVDSEQLASLFISRGIWLTFARRRPQAAAYFREAVRLGELAGSSIVVGRALLNLSDTLAVDDSAGAIEAARSAMLLLRRAGDRDRLVFAVSNLCAGLLAVGDWDGAAAALSESLEIEGLTDTGFIPVYQQWLGAMRGQPADQAQLERLAALYTSEDVQDLSFAGLAAAFHADLRGEPEEALRLAQAVVAYAARIGIGAEASRWGWPLGTRVARQLGENATVREFLALVDAYPPAELPVAIRVERRLVLALLAIDEGDPDGDAALAEAIELLRLDSTPYHLAQGLLDLAERLSSLGDCEAASAAIDEARQIAERLGCQPVLDRANQILARSPSAIRV
jgi:class 3 adenylate cyclase/tetratricopeptide (TPR) repeat protein